MSDPKHIVLAKKLNELAKKGVGGEAKNAEMFLTQLLKKHNLTIEEIDGEKIEDHFFNIEARHERLLHQIVKLTSRSLSLYGEIPKTKIKQLGLKGNYLTSCTASHFIEISAKFDFYKNLLDEEYRIFYRAFLGANNLLTQADPNKNPNQLTPKEIEDVLREQALAENIKVGEYHRQLKS